MNLAADSYPIVLLRAAFALALSACLLLGLFIWQEGNRQSSAAPFIEVPGDELQAIVGRASVTDQRLDFESFAQQNGKYHAIAVWRGGIKARDYPVVVLDFASPVDRLALNLTWRRADDPGTIHSTEFSRGSLGDPAVLMTEESNWRNTIIEVALYAIGTEQQPLSIEAMMFEPGGWRSRLRALGSEWTTFRGWTHRSINYLRYFPGEEGVSPLPWVALWTGLALLIVLATALVARRGVMRAVVPVLFIPWLILDLAWQRELLAQLEVTRDRFAGKTVEEKHQADDDAWIYNQVKRLRADILPQPPARIVIAHSPGGHNYERLKTQYYLLPHNVYNFGKGPRLTALRRGDYFLVMTNSRDPRFVQDRGRLIWNRGISVEAEEIDVSDLGRLYRLTDPQLPEVSDG